MSKFIKFIKKQIDNIDKFLAKISIIAIKNYQKTLSPDKGIFSFRLKGKICSHEPHCSQYGILCLQRYQFLKGIPKIINRILHCLPSMHKIYDPEHYRVVFISSAPIGVPFLEHLISDKRFEVIGVVTQPEKPIGRQLKIQDNIIKTKAQELGIKENDIQTPNKINPDKSIEGKNFYDWLIEKQPDFLVVIAYGKIIPEAILNIPIFGPINVHGSLLPKYRGASPIQTVFLNKEKESGITIMHMDNGMDTGAIIDQVNFPIPFEWTCLESIQHMQEIGPDFLNKTLRNYGKNHIRTRKQNENQVINCKKIQKSDGNINIYSESLKDIYAKYRAYFLRPKIFFEYKGKKIIIEKLIIDKKIFEQQEDNPLLLGNGNLNSAIIDIQLKPEGKKIMNRISFKNGYLK